MSVEFSAKLSALRRERGVSQKQAAESLGISQALLSHYEKGIRECNLDFVKKVAGYYDVSADYLLGLTDSRQRMTEIADPEDIPGDSRMRAVTVLRDLLYLSQQAENSDEAVQMFFSDFFALCVKKYTAALERRDGRLSRLCDVSMNRLCAEAPTLESDDAPPLFAKTVDDHAMLLLNSDVAQAFQS